MIVLQGYYDGEAIQPLEKIYAEKNQRLIITVLDEFIQEVPEKEKQRTARDHYPNMQILLYGSRKNQHGKRW